MPLNYSIVTSAKNESPYLPATIESVLGQSILPVEWIIVDDGSTDDTGAIVDRFAQQHAWIKKIHLDNFRPDLKTTGGRVGHILNLAVSNLRERSSLIVKLDADTSFKETFFEDLLREFEKNSALGIASGTLVFNGKPEKVDYDTQMVRGAVMMIRQEVFETTKGFPESRGSGEDTLFGVAARYHGWHTRSFPVYFEHLKPEGIRHGPVREAFVAGFYKGSIPYRFDYFTMTLFKSMFRNPPVVGALVQLSGYIYTRFISRYRPFPAFITQQLRLEQKQRLARLGKR